MTRSFSDQAGGNSTSDISVDANTSSSTTPTRVQNIEDNRYDSMEDGGSSMTATIDRKAARFLYFVQTEQQLCRPDHLRFSKRPVLYLRRYEI